MKKTRKGFTLVELLVVIAIVAILATVAIIGYTSFTKKAEESSDRTLVAQLNTAITRVDGGKYSIHEAAELLKEHGFDISKIDATAKNQEILFVDGRFFYTADENPEGEIWIIDDVVSDTYNTYYIGGESITSNTSKAICVATNGTNLTINAPHADVYHYGDVDDLTIEAVANASYHEYGRVTGLATVKAGHVVVENGGSIGTLVVENAGVTLSGSFGIVVAESNILAGLNVEAEQKVEAGSLENLGSAVALVGNTFYDDFADALEVGGTIILVRDVAYATNKIFTVNADQTVTIDLNGHVMAAIAGESSASAVITNKGNLTIKDSVGGGKITTSALNPDENSIPGYASNTINNYGTLVLDGGIIENTTTGAAAAYAVDCFGGSTFTMNGGELVSAFDALRLLASGTNEVVATINGGKITGTGSPIWVHALGGSVKLNITGGTFVDAGSDKWAAIHLGQSSARITAAEINITGGTIQGDVYIPPIFEGSVTIGNGVKLSGNVIHDTDDNCQN